jgi:hypothetical protein
MFVLTKSKKKALIREVLMNKYRLSDKVRLFHYEEDGIKHSVNLRQIVALRDFADVQAGSEGGWLDDEAALSQAGTCWIYDPNSAVFAGARIEGNARLTEPASSATSLSSATMHGSTRHHQPSRPYL